MHYTIEKIIKGDGRVIAWYEAALKMWKTILSETGTCDVRKLAARVTIEQPTFERACGGRWCGQEIMVVAGICQFYSTEIGFQDHEAEVLAIYDAFQASYCSLVVKSIADDVANAYSIKELRQ